MHGTSIIPSKMTVEKVMKMTNLFLIIFNSFWLGFRIYLSNSLKSICRLTVSLIDERALICDHSQLTLKFCWIFEIFEFSSCRNLWKVVRKEYSLEFSELTMVYQIIDTISEWWERPFCFDFETWSLLLYNLINLKWR